MPSFTVPTVIKSALQELQVQDPGETVGAADQADAINILNRMLDGWNADRRKVYVSKKTNFTLTASLSPHTIGPTGGTFTTTTNRPVSIDAANLVLTDGTRIAIRMRDSSWYAAQTTPALTSSIPTDLYYEPDFSSGLGNLWFWPVPDTAYTVDLWMRVVLAQVVAADSVDLPPGYLDAVIYSLAERLAPSYGVQVQPALRQMANSARLMAFGNNHDAPRMSTDDSDVMSTRGGLFRYRTGGLT